jgi:hypothetical protein
MYGLLHYGRAIVQDFVVKSRDVNDAVNYIQAERGLEFVKRISFVTTNLLSFEKKTYTPSSPGATVNPTQLPGQGAELQHPCIFSIIHKTSEK